MKIIKKTLAVIAIICVLIIKVPVHILNFVFGYINLTIAEISVKLGRVLDYEPFTEGLCEAMDKNIDNYKAGVWLCEEWKDELV